MRGSDRSRRKANTLGSYNRRRGADAAAAAAIRVADEWREIRAQAKVVVP